MYVFLAIVSVVFLFVLIAAMLGGCPHEFCWPAQHDGEYFFICVHCQRLQRKNENGQWYWSEETLREWAKRKTAGVKP